jgi:hypothetical protein
MGDAADMAREQEEDLLFDILVNRKNVWLEHRQKNNKTWMKLDGTIVKIKDMSTNHIINCIKLLDNADACINATQLPAYKGLTKELNKRTKL